MKLRFKEYISKLKKIQNVLPHNVNKAVVEIKDVFSYHLVNATFWNPAATYVSPSWRAGTPYTLIDSGALKSAMRKSFRYRKSGEFLTGFFINAETMDQLNVQESNTMGESSNTFPYWRNFEYGASGSRWTGFKFTYDNLNLARGHMTFAGGSSSYKYPGIKPVQMFARTQAGLKGRRDWYRSKLVNAVKATAKKKTYSGSKLFESAT